MIRGVHIARYRGIRELTAEGFGRVNLIIGRNDCGKTAFMEALQLAEDAKNAARYLLQTQRERLGRVAATQDFERFWRPIFSDFDATTGFSIWLIDDAGRREVLEVRQGAVPPTVIPAGNGARNIHEPNDEVYDDSQLEISRAWTIDIQHTTVDGRQRLQRIVATSSQITLPPPVGHGGSGWVSPKIVTREVDVRHVSTLKQRGEVGELLELLREVDERLFSIELLSPGGSVAELFVRLNDGTPMLPIALMGEGFQSCLSLGAGAAVHEWPILFIDEIENGMHHLVLEQLWRWIAKVSLHRGLQIFATTHSEECIHAACRAFQDPQDDGLRVIRLDRLESGTRATIYDRELIEAAERTGTEIRG